MLIVPEDSNSETNSNALILDMGSITMTSDVRRRQQGVDYLALTEFANIYDIYDLRIENIQIYKKNLSLAAVNSLKHNYVRKLNFQAKLYNCLEIAHPTFPALRVGGILNRVDIVMTDENIRFLFCILKHVMKEQAVFSKKISAKDIYKLKEGITETKTEIDAAVKEEIAKIKEEAKSPTEKETKKEEAPQKPAAVVVIPPNKIMKEIIIHFDGINIETGKTIHEADKFYEVMDHLDI